MSIISDVRDLYGTLETTWDDSRAHVITHLVFAVVVFWLGDIGLPKISTPSLDPKTIMDNDWFKLAKDTGIIYAALVIPIIGASIYAALLRKFGQAFLTVTSFVIASGRTTSPFVGLSEYDLEPLALLVKKDDLQLSDLTEKMSELAFKYQSKKTELWVSYQKAVTAITRNSVQYFGDFSIFLTAWIIVFELLPHSTWVAANRHSFWPVTVVLLVLVIWSWLRVSRALRFLPRFQMQAISAMARIDSDTVPIAEISEDQRQQVVQKLKELLKKEQRRKDESQTISIRNLLLARFPSFGARTRYVFSISTTGWPFPRLYEKGASLVSDSKRIRRSQGFSMADVAAYFYYSLCERISRTIDFFAQLIKYFLFGVP
jgi:hypothetical protein